MSNPKKALHARIIALLLMCGLAAGLVSFNSRDVYAANLVLTGDTAGLRITPENEDLFRIGNMLPGESASSSIEIRNTDNYAFALSVEVENLITPSEGGPDFLDVLDIIVSMNNQVIASFPAKGGAYTLGVFRPGQTAALDVDILFQNAGNEYQGKSTELQWIFRAVSDYTDPGPLPDPGPGPRRTTVTEPTLLTMETPEVVPLSIEEIYEEEPPLSVVLPYENTVELPEEEVPQGESELVEIAEEDTPQGPKEMPKTGEMTLTVFLMSGAVVCGVGVGLLFGGRKKKKRSCDL